MLEKQRFQSAMKHAVIHTFAVLAFLGLGTGCSRLGPYNVGVQSTNPTDSIQVDVVGVNEAEYDLWANFPMDDYWAPGNAFRRNAKDKLVLRFGMGRPQKQTISTKDKAWKAWDARKCRYLFVLTNAGSFGGGASPSGDPRRLILPLEKKRWDGRNIEIEVRSGGLICVNGPKPE